ncbi:MAG TPA: hypothetical protein VFH70_13760, partial [Acidimicrobiales bacterium]|nr:hypothetical protein [Acidimicrobiales bacterium]
MNLSAMEAAVYARLGVDSTDGLLTPTVIDGFINDANHQIELAHDWPWLQATETIATVSGTDTYTPGSTGALWHRTVELRDGIDAMVLERYSATELDDRWLPQEMGRPREFAIYGDQIILRPVPDGVYNIVHRYIRQEPDLVNP